MFSPSRLTAVLLYSNLSHIWIRLLSKLVEDSRLAIDQKKNELQEAIRQLNSSRNDLAPISSLPPELLGRTFAFATNDQFLQNASAFPFNFSIWLNFTYVSQRWRNVALDTPNLWCNPPIWYRKWARVYLERSKVTDLVIDSDVSLSDKDLLKEVFDNHATRIRELTLRGLSPSPLSEILENVQPSSLRLHLLNLSVVFGCAGTVFCADYLAHPSDLRHLTIQGCSFDLFTKPLTQLTHLEIHEVSMAPLLSEFAAALSLMPAMESITMSSSLLLAYKAVKLNLKVELPKLCLLSLASTKNVFEVLNILDFLIVPNTTVVRLQLGSQAQPSIVSQFGQFFSCMTGNVDAGSYKALRLCYVGNASKLVAWRQERQGNNIDLSDLSISFGSSSYGAEHLFDDVLPVLPLDLRTLIIGVSCGQGFLLKHFGKYPTLQNVEHQYGEFHVFLQALTRKPEGYERLESAFYDVPFPALRSLTVSSPYDLENFCDVLIERYERGAGLQKLSLNECPYIDEQHIRRLREIVVDVEWDEFETEETNSEEHGNYCECYDCNDYDLYHDFIDDN